MKIWTISDLHLRQNDAISLVKPDRFPEADVCVVAGDVCDSMHISVNWLGKVIRPRMPVVYVLGNHEFYDTSIENGRKNARMIAKALDVTLLDDSSAVIDGVRFVGGTLWTDFKLMATGDGEEQKAQVARAMYLAKHGLMDYTNIYMQGAVKNGIIPRFIKPKDTQEMHFHTRGFLKREILTPFDGPTVVVTHHAPHPLSVHPKYAEDPVTPAFVSDLSSLIDRAQPDLWIHGHVHQPFDYVVGKTRIACNPRGYGLENPDFEFSKVIEIGKDPTPVP